MTKNKKDYVPTKKEKDQFWKDFGEQVDYEYDVNPEYVFEQQPYRKGIPDEFTDSMNEMRARDSKDPFTRYSHAMNVVFFTANEVLKKRYMGIAKEFLEKLMPALCENLKNGLDLIRSGLTDKKSDKRKLVVLLSKIVTWITDLERKGNFDNGILFGTKFHTLAELSRALKGTEPDPHIIDIMKTAAMESPSAFRKRMNGTIDGQERALKHIEKKRNRKSPYR